MAHFRLKIERTGLVGPCPSLLHEKRKREWSLFRINLPMTPCIPVCRDCARAEMLMIQVAFARMACERFQLDPDTEYGCRRLRELVMERFQISATTAGRIVNRFLAYEESRKDA